MILTKYVNLAWSGFNGRPIEPGDVNSFTYLYTTRYIKQGDTDIVADVISQNRQIYLGYL